MHTTERLWDTDPLTGTKTFFRMEDGAKTFDLITESTVDPILEENQRLRKEDPNFKGDQVRVASIPMAVWSELMRKGIAQDETEMKKWLNDRDNEVFRTARGRV